jgi:hypothetical protein
MAERGLNFDPDITMLTQCCISYIAIPARHITSDKFDFHSAKASGKQGFAGSGPNGTLRQLTIQITTSTRAFAADLLQMQLS